MVEQQKPLFSVIPGLIEEKRFLNVLLNGASARMKFRDLFVPSQTGFDSIKLATYVASPSYLNKLKDFSRVRLVVGEEDEGRRLMAMNLNPENEYLNSLDGDMLKKVDSEAFEIRIPPMGETVHSKIYIFMNSDTGEKRVMVGSANFTRTAMTGKQYEELVIYDSRVNPSFCQFYEARFEEIWKQSISFFAPITRRKIRMSIVSADTVTAGRIEDSLIVAGNVDADNIENCTVINLSFSPEENAQRIIEKMHMNIPFQENLPDCREQLQETMDRLVDIKHEHHATNEILDLVLKRVRGKEVIKPKIELIRAKETIKEKFIASSRKSLDVLNKINRPGMSYDHIKDILYYRADGGDGPVIAYPEKLDRADLERELARLSSFVKSYSLFTTHKDEGENEQTEQKVFEAILFAFVSPFIWQIRKKVDLEYSREKLAEIPVFMIIGGQANTGKTKLIRSISLMTGGGGHYADYKTIESQRHRVISDVLLSENVYPLIVDEVSPRFFKNSGEAVIKSLSNTTEGARPVFIGATNQEFTAESQVIRRVYYLNFGNPIDPDKRKDAETYFEKNVGEINDRLFRHFLVLFHEQFLSGGEIYHIDDPLWYGREIFKQIYKETLDESPGFINDRPIGDYYRTGELQWHSLYRSSKEMFTTLKVGDEVYLTVNMAKEFQAVRDANALVKKLPPGIVKTPGAVLVLYKERFLSFIGEKEGFAKRLARIFRS